MKFWNTLSEHLSRPEYVHVLINPLPVYGLAVALVALMIAMVSQNRVAVGIGLAAEIADLCFGARRNTGPDRGAPASVR